VCQLSKIAGVGVARGRKGVRYTEMGIHLPNHRERLGTAFPKLFWQWERRGNQLYRWTVLKHPVCTKILLFVSQNRSLFKPNVARPSPNVFFLHFILGNDPSPESWNGSFSCILKIIDIIVRARGLYQPHGEQKLSNNNNNVYRLKLPWLFDTAEINFLRCQRSLRILVLWLLITIELIFELLCCWNQPILLRFKCAVMV